MIDVDKMNRIIDALEETSKELSKFSDTVEKVDGNTEEIKRACNVVDNSTKELKAFTEKEEAKQEKVLSTMHTLSGKHFDYSGKWFTYLSQKADNLINATENLKKSIDESTKALKQIKLFVLLFGIGISVLILINILITLF